MVVDQYVVEIAQYLVEMFKLLVSKPPWWSLALKIYRVFIK